MLRSSSNQGSAEIKRALAYQRKKLKMKLWQERAVPTEIWDGADFFVTVAEMPYAMPLPAGNIDLPVCPYCGEAIKRMDNTAMHEWLIKRNSLPVKLQHKVMVEENCILAHNEPCHAEYGQTKEFKLRCAKAQFELYGRDQIVAWVESLGLKQAVEIPDIDSDDMGYDLGPDFWHGPFAS